MPDWRDHLMAEHPEARLIAERVIDILDVPHPGLVTQAEKSIAIELAAMLFEMGGAYAGR